MQWVQNDDQAYEWNRINARKNWLLKMNYICGSDNEQMMAKIKSPYVRQSWNFNANLQFFFYLSHSCYLFCHLFSSRAKFILATALSKEFDFEFQVRLTVAVFSIPYLIYLSFLVSNTDTTHTTYIRIHVCLTEVEHVCNVTFVSNYCI